MREVDEKQEISLLWPYRTYKIISSYELPRPVMGTIFLVEEHLLTAHTLW